MARRKYAKLKSLMYEQEMTQKELAQATSKGITYISRRLAGHEPFNTRDIQEIAAVLEIPSSEWLAFFFEGVTA